MSGLHSCFYLTQINMYREKFEQKFIKPNLWELASNVFEFILNFNEILSKALQQFDFWVIRFYDCESIVFTVCISFLVYHRLRASINFCRTYVTTSLFACFHSTILSHCSSWNLLHRQYVDVYLMCNFIACDVTAKERKILSSRERVTSSVSVSFVGRAPLFIPCLIIWLS